MLIARPTRVRDYDGPLSVFLQAPARPDEAVARVLGPGGYTRCWHNREGWVVHSTKYHACRCDES